MINLISKDHATGWSILLVRIAIAMIYSYALFFLEPISTASIWLWIIDILVFAAFMVFFGIGAWIGLTMATTPKPKTVEGSN